MRLPLTWEPWPIPNPAPGAAAPPRLPLRYTAARRSILNLEDQKRETLANLPDCRLHGPGSVTSAFLKLGIRTYREAAEHVWKLPYGRNLGKSDLLSVLSEARGTCSTKHALLASLAMEQSVGEVKLFLGIYEMNGANTPGTGDVLRNHCLACIPEAHCYLRTPSNRIDLTHPPGSESEPIAGFLREVEIQPEQISGFKAAFHKEFLHEWSESDKANGKTPEELWLVREQCIEALAADQ